MLLIINWLRSLTAYVFLALYMGIVGPPALVAAMLTGRAGHVFTLGRFGASAVRRLLGLRLETSGLEHVVGDRPTVYCINHRSHVDVVAFEALFPRCPRLRGLYKAEMGKLPVLGRALRLVGFVAVERANRASAIASVDAAAERLRAGDSFLLAPEGTRARTDELLPFKKGGFVMAIKAQVPVVPVALHGTAEAMPRGRFWVKPSVIRVEVGEPIPTTGLTLDDRDRLTTTVRDRMQAMLQRPLAIAEVVVVRIVLDRALAVGEEDERLVAGDLEAPPARGARHEVVGADHVVAQLRELRAVAFVGARRQAVFLDAGHPANLELVAPLAVRARVGRGLRFRRLDVEVPLLQRHPLIIAGGARGGPVTRQSGGRPHDSHRH